MVPAMILTTITILLTCTTHLVRSTPPIRLAQVPKELWPLPKPMWAGETARGRLIGADTKVGPSYESGDSVPVSSPNRARTADKPIIFKTRQSDRLYLGVGAAQENLPIDGKLRMYWEGESAPDYKDERSQHIVDLVEAQDQRSQNVLSINGPSSAYLDSNSSAISLNITKSQGQNIEISPEIMGIERTEATGDNLGVGSLDRDENPWSPLAEDKWSNASDINQNLNLDNGTIPTVLPTTFILRNDLPTLNREGIEEDRNEIENTEVEGANEQNSQTREEIQNAPEIVNLETEEVDLPAISNANLIENRGEIGSENLTSSTVLSETNNLGSSATGDRTDGDQGIAEDSGDSVGQVSVTPESSVIPLNPIATDILAKDDTKDIWTSNGTKIDLAEFYGQSRQTTYSPPGRRVGKRSKVLKVKVACDETSNEMKLRILLDEGFRGLIYAEGHLSEDGCKIRGQGTDQELIFTLPLDGCGTLPKTNRDVSWYENKVVLLFEQDQDLLSDLDRVYYLRCMFKEIPARDVSSFIVVDKPQPNVITGVTERRAKAQMKIVLGGDPTDQSIDTLRIGSRATMVVYLDEESGSGYNFFINQCYAHDGTKSKKIPLFDDKGCPEPNSVMGIQKRITLPPLDQKSVYSHFVVFKFPDSASVYFDCKVAICGFDCELPKCNGEVEASDTSNFTFTHVVKREINPQYQETKFIMDAAHSGFEVVIDQENINRLRNDGGVPIKSAQIRAIGQDGDEPRWAKLVSQPSSPTDAVSLSVVAGHLCLSRTNMAVAVAMLATMLASIVALLSWVCARHSRKAKDYSDDKLRGSNNTGACDIVGLPIQPPCANSTGGHYPNSRQNFLGSLFNATGRPHDTPDQSLGYHYQDGPQYMDHGQVPFDHHHKQYRNNSQQIPDSGPGVKPATEARADSSHNSSRTSAGLVNGLGQALAKQNGAYVRDDGGSIGLNELTMIPNRFIHNGISNERTTVRK